MRLSEVPIENIIVGLEVIGANGVHGKVEKIISKDTTKGEDNEIIIVWDNGNVSQAWHFWCNKVTLKN